MNPFVWFYEVCIRLGELDMIKRGSGGEKYRDDEYPSATEIKKLNAAFKSRTPEENARLDSEFEKRNKPPHYGA